MIAWPRLSMVRAGAGICAEPNFTSTSTLVAPAMNIGSAWISRSPDVSSACHVGFLPAFRARGSHLELILEHREIRLRDVGAAPSDRHQGGGLRCEQAISVQVEARPVSSFPQMTRPVCVHWSLLRSFFTWFGAPSRRMPSAGGQPAASRRAHASTTASRKRRKSRMSTLPSGAEYVGPLRGGRSLDRVGGLFAGAAADDDGDSRRATGRSNPPDPSTRPAPAITTQ